MFSNDLYSLQNPPRPLGHPAATAQLPHTSASSNLVPLVSIPTAPPRKMTNQRVGSEPDGEGLSWRCPRITNFRQRGRKRKPWFGLGSALGDWPVGTSEEILGLVGLSFHLLSISGIGRADACERGREATSPPKKE